MNDAATIAHAVVDASSADEYDPVANEDLAVSVTDDDTAGITVTAADPFTVAEGSQRHLHRGTGHRTRPPTSSSASPSRAAPR